VAPLVLEFASDDGVAARALEALYHAAPATDDPPTLRYTLRRTGTGPAAGYEAGSPAQPLFGPASLTDAWAFLEWRATEDVLNAATADLLFVHAGAAVLGNRMVLLIGDPGAGKSTLVTHLMMRGHDVLGDDVVRFATRDGRYSAVGRSFKLDDKALRGMPLVAALCAAGTLGTLLAAGCYYVSPAAIRRTWHGSAARPWAVVLLDAGARIGASGVQRSSEGEAAVVASRKLLGGAALPAPVRAGATVRLLESLEDAVAYRAVGADPARVAEALEREAMR